MALTIDELEIKIETEASDASSGLDALERSLQKLNSAIGPSTGLASNLTSIATALKSFENVGKIKLTSQINQMQKLGGLTSVLGSAEAAQFAQNLRDIADGLSSIGGVGKTNLGTTINALGKIPDITNTLKPEILDEFADKVNRITAIMKPLGTQMDKVARGFNAMPRSIGKVNRAAVSLGSSNKSLLFTASELANQYKRLYQVFDEIIDISADLFNVSNDYVEALNLFKVSMGDASDAALEYSEVISDAMGIDPVEWISNQGVFQRMSTGFGIVSDEAEIMSQNLTQLAYDLSSFFNTDIQTAMQKLQSGMSGQIKGLKAWGYNLSVAALQETALSLGIEESVRNMSEAQKAQLRYITLIQRSNGIMGDMAKTINTPANALRILDAQITKFKRSLGNLVSVIATRAIPYVQAFIEVMAEAAEALAVSWGFEIDELPTNNLEMASDVIDGIGDGVEDTTDAVSELKKQLMGFDELNILSDSTEDTNVSNSLNIELPEYDFLANLDNKTRETIDGIKAKIQELLPLLETLTKAFALAFAVKVFDDARKAIGNFFTNTDLGIYTAITASDAWESFTKTIKATHNPLKALASAGKTVWKNFKEIMSSLNPLTKAIVSVVALGVEFNVVKDAVYDFNTGSKTLGETLLSIVPICGAVGVAMYAMLGPWGLVAAAITGVIAATAGFIEAENDLRKQLSHASFYDGYGRSVSDLATDFENLMTATTEAYDPILEMNEKILGSKVSLDNAKESVGLLVEGVENGVIPIEEACERIVDALKSIYEDTNKYLTETRDLILYALTGSIGKGLSGLEIDISESLAASGKITQEALNKAKEINAQNELLFAELEKGGVSDPRYNEIWGALTENYNKLADLSGGVQDISGAEIEAAKSSVAEIFAEGIKWESDNLESELTRFANAADGAKATIEEAYGGVIEALESQKALAERLGDTDSASALGNTIAGTKTLMEQELAGIDSMLSEAVTVEQMDLVNELQKIYDGIDEEWDALGFWEKTFVYDSDKNDYISARMADYQEELAPIIEAMKSAFGDDAIFADEVIDNIGKSMFGDKKGFSNDFWVAVLDADFTSMPEEIEKAIFSNGQALIAALKSGYSADDYSFIKDTATGSIKILKDGVEFAVVQNTPGLEAKLKEMGVNISEGLRDGVEEQIAKDEPWYKKAWNSIVNWFKNLFGIHSPSTVFKQLGSYLSTGLKNGVDENINSSDYESIFSRIGKGFSDAWGAITSWWEGLSLPEIDLKMPHFEWTTRPAEGWMAKALSAVGLEPQLPKLNVEWYASGGFPTMGQMFIARESGPELVGRIGNKNAVANNDQITAGIASAVYSAMMAAQEDSGGSGGTPARIIVQIGDTAVGEASVRYINGQIVQTGASPIYN